VSAQKPRVLVIDDEAQIHRFLGAALEAAGYEPLRADNGAEGLSAIAWRAPDAVILDLDLPDMDGQDALIRARAFYGGPILIVSKRRLETEKIDALDLGADDYLEKPFSIGELLARLRVASRHRLADAGSAPVVETGALRIDLVKRLVTRAGMPVKLSPREYELLVTLVAGAGRVLTHRRLLTVLRGHSNATDVRYLRVFVGNLRQKLEADASNPRHLITETGVGYRFVVD
jgi:two-component system KDP operon response regulator KdpE